MITLQTPPVPISVSLFTILNSVLIVSTVLMSIGYLRLTTSGGGGTSGSTTSGGGGGTTTTRTTTTTTTTRGIHLDQFLLFGDSITQFSFNPHELGWGASLADSYARKLDVVNRGYSGYNTEMCKHLISSNDEKK